MPISDPHQRIAYVEQFRSSIRYFDGAKDMTNWLDNLRADMRTLPAGIAAQAEDLVSIIASRGYHEKEGVLPFRRYVTEATDNLIAFLKKNTLPPG